MYQYDLKFLNDITLDGEQKFNIYYNIIMQNKNMDKIYIWHLRILQNHR